MCVAKVLAAVVMGVLKGSLDLGVVTKATVGVLLTYVTTAHVLRVGMDTGEGVNKLCRRLL